MKMNMLMVYSFVCLLLGVLVSRCEGAMYFEKDAFDGDNPRRCYSSVYNQQLVVNRVYRTPECGRMQCGSNFVIAYSTCGAITIPEGCVERPGNLKLPYPRCCPDFYCENNISSSQEDKEFSMVL